MSLLSIVQTAAMEVGIPKPAYVVSSPDIQVQQLLALANRAGRELAQYPVKDSCWSALQRQYLFDTAFMTVSGSCTKGSNVLQVASTDGISVGMGVTDDAGALPKACMVTSINAGADTIALDATQLATVSATGVTYTLSQIAYPLPADYDHAANQTFWDRNFRWQMLGPLNAQEWQVLKSGIAPTGPRIRFRIFQGQIWVDPYPTEVDTLAFEYLSNAWCQSSAGAAQSSWAADTDTGVLDENLLTLSLIWRWRAAKGLPYDEEYQTYTRAVERAASRDGGGARSLLINRQTMSSPLLTAAQIPDSGYGQPSA